MSIVRLVPAAPLDAFVAVLWWSRRAAPYIEHCVSSHGDGMLPP
jgi:hypothetical protein